MYMSLEPSAGPVSRGRPKRSGPAPPPWGLGPPRGLGGPGPPEPQWAIAAVVEPRAIRGAWGGT